MRASPLLCLIILFPTSTPPCHPVLLRILSVSAGAFLNWMTIYKHTLKKTVLWVNGIRVGMCVCVYTAVAVHRTFVLHERFLTLLQGESLQVLLYWQCKWTRLILIYSTWCIKDEVSQRSGCFIIRRPEYSERLLFVRGKMKRSCWVSGGIY